jgi:hypothetical protein
MHKIILNYFCYYKSISFGKNLKMSIHTLYGKWHHWRIISLVILITGLVASSGLCVYALRQNNLTMVRLRTAVYETDANGGDVETALNNLRQFVYSHMNTNLRSGSSSEPPIQLVNRFNAAVEAEEARIAALTGAANQVYVDAQRQCEISSVPLTVRAQCIQDYVSAHGTGIPQLNLPDKSFYTFDFASPTWSPDLAGYSMLAAIGFGLLLIIRIVTGLFIRRYLKQ